MGRVLKPCGTPAAYARHRRHYEVPCDACEAANTAKSAAYRRQLAELLGYPSDPALAPQRRADIAAAVYTDKRRLPARRAAALRGEL